MSRENPMVYIYGNASMCTQMAESPITPPPDGTALVATASYNADTGKVIMRSRNRRTKYWQRAVSKRDALAIVNGLVANSGVWIDLWSDMGDAA